MFVVANIKRKNEKNNIKTKKIIFFEGSFGTELASIGTGSQIKQKPEGVSFGRTINNYNYGLR